MDKEEVIEAKEKIKEKLKSKELTEMIVSLISFIMLSGIFGYIGYKYCLDNNYDMQKGIVFGALFPIGLALLKEYGLGNIITYIVYTIIYIIALDYVPTYVGIIVLFIIVLAFIAVFVFILKKDRTEEINRNYNMQRYKTIHKTRYTNLNQCVPKTIHSDETTEYDNEYECERCFEKISEEEYELHDGMCEECFIEVHTDKNGHFHSDKYFDL